MNRVMWNRVKWGLPVFHFAYHTFFPRGRQSRLDKYKIYSKQTTYSVGVTWQQTWLCNEKLLRSLGENLDILTDLMITPTHFRGKFKICCRSLHDLALRTSEDLIFLYGGKCLCCQTVVHSISFSKNRSICKWAN